MKSMTLIIFILYIQTHISLTNLLLHFFILLSPPSPEKCHFNIDKSFTRVFHELRDNGIQNVLKAIDFMVNDISVKILLKKKYFFTDTLLDMSNLDSNIRNVFSRAIVVLIHCFQPTDVIVCMRYKMYIQHSILSKINEKVFSMKLLIFIIYHLVIQYYLTNFDFISWITFGFGHES